MDFLIHLRPMCLVNMKFKSYPVQTRAAASPPHKTSEPRIGLNVTLTDWVKRLACFNVLNHIPSERVPQPIPSQTTSEARIGLNVTFTDWVKRHACFNVLNHIPSKRVPPLFLRTKPLSRGLD